MLLREFLKSNGENIKYLVGLHTIDPNHDPAVFTAFRLVGFLADSFECAEGVIQFFQQGEYELTLIEDALYGGKVENDAWVGGYANLVVPIEGFEKNVIVTVQKIKNEG